MTAESKRLARIAGAVVLMLGVVVAASSLAPAGYAPWEPTPLLVADPNALPGEAETFRGAAIDGAALREVSQQKGGARNLSNYDERRAFPGAPPAIPHDLFEDRSMGGKGCLGCHADGGYVPPFKAYAPVTPHPDMLNCRQCHVAQQKGQTQFGKGSQWTKVSGPVVDQQALPGGPPPIPHTLEMRGNCVACHAGPAAVAEIRTPHPERGNCRQCHVPSTADSSAVFERGGAR